MCRCGCENYPLLKTINRVLRAYSTPDPGCAPLATSSAAPRFAAYSLPLEAAAAEPHRPLWRPFSPALIQPYDKPVFSYNFK